MKNHKFLTLFAVALAIFGNSLSVKAAACAVNDIEKFMQKGDGVYVLEKDDNGKVSSCVAVVSEEVKFNGSSAVSRDMAFTKLRMQATCKIVELIKPESVKTEVVEKKSSNGTVSRKYTRQMSASISGVTEIARMQRRNKNGKMEYVLVAMWSNDSENIAKKLSQKTNSKE